MTFQIIDGFLAILQILQRFPCCFLKWPALPLDEILCGVSSPTLAQYTLDLVLCFTRVVKFGRIDFRSQFLDARREYGAAVAVRFQQMDVEDRVDLQCSIG